MQQGTLKIVNIAYVTMAISGLVLHFMAVPNKEEVKKIKPRTELKMSLSQNSIEQNNVTLRPRMTIEKSTVVAAQD